QDREREQERPGCEPPAPGTTGCDDGREHVDVRVAHGVPHPSSRRKQSIERESRGDHEQREQEQWMAEGHRGTQSRSTWTKVGVSEIARVARMLSFTTPLPVRRCTMTALTSPAVGGVDP